MKIDRRSLIILAILTGTSSAPAATLLAGTHMAQAVMPTSSEDQPRLVPIQFGGYGYPRGYYYGYSPFREGPGGYLEPNYGPRYYGRENVIPPDALPLIHRWRWENDQRGRYYNPPWAGRGW